MSVDSGDIFSHKSIPEMHNICIYDSDEVFAISSILYDFNARNAQFTGEMTFWFDES